jgi:alkylation response protein AidB-like acyl-CoA dehydrogenase
MDFSFSDDQQELRSAVAKVLSDWCTPADLHARYVALDADTGRATGRWEAIADLGVCGLLIDENAGGLGLTDVDLIGIAEEAGRVVLPEPLSTTAGVVFPIAASTPAGAPVVAAALEQGLSATFGGVAFGPKRHSVSTTLEGTTATTPRVANGSADLFLLVADLGGELQVHLAKNDGVNVVATPSLDLTRDLATIHWTPTAETLIASGEAATALVEELLQRAALYSAAELLGLCDAMLTLTASYVSERKQFGVPVGSFQAVKHHLAGARVRLEFARPALYRAAYSLATNASTAAHDVSMAKSMASDAADEAARVSLQCHGAIGYTFEYDLHLAMKRAWALSADFGDARSHRTRVFEFVSAARA